MALSAGTRLGPYEISGSLGAGGMGEVYKARDTRLDREVAIKILPAEVAHDPERQSRFQQEARAAGALHHPSIVAVHDIGREGDVSYIVTELVVGESLREVVNRGAVPPRRIVEIVTQAAEGLAAAHAAGIVHRDIKPENIMIQRDGRVKILDFGLAKQSLFRARERDSTVTEAVTRPGVAMGTIGYMSPEQIRGEPADPRSDLFSLGAVAYEMLTGKRAFQGKSSIEILHAILKDEPAEFDPGVQTVLERVIRHALEKEPARRFQDASDMAFALQAVASNSSAAAMPPLAVPRRRRWRIAAAVIAVALCGGAGFWWGTRRPVETYPLFHLLLSAPGGFDARFTSDGTRVVYSKAAGRDFQAQVVTLATGETRDLQLPARSGILAVSSKDEIAARTPAPGGNWFLTRVPLSGGAPRQMMEGVEEADWSPDGSQLAIVRQVGSRYRLEYPIGTVWYETDAAVGEILQCRVSHSGDRVAFVERTASPATLWLKIAAGPGKISILTASRQQSSPIRPPVSWSPGDREIWWRRWPLNALQQDVDRALIAVAMNGRTRRLATLPATDLLDVAPDGTALVRIGLDWGGLRVAGVDGSDREIVTGTDVFGSISADGRNVLYYKGGGLFLQPVAGGAPVHLTDGLPGQFSPDGRSVLVHRSVQGQISLVPIGPGEEKRILFSGIADGDMGSIDFIDSKHVLFSVEPSHRPQSLYIGDLDTLAARRLPVEVADVPRRSRLSPDGTRFFGERSDGRYYVYSLDGKSRPISGLGSSESPLGWTPDSQGFWLYSDRTIYRLGFDGKRTRWMGFDASSGGLANFQITPDGKSVLYNATGGGSSLYTVKGW